MHKKTLAFVAIATLFLGLSAFAQDTNAPAAAVAGTNAPAADTTPKPDPAGTATGLSVDAQADQAVAVIVKAAKTGKIGDGKVFISNIEEAIRIRTEEKGEQAV